MSFYQKLYGFLPVGLQNLAVSGYGYFWKKRRFGGIFEKELIGFKEREHFSKIQWDGYVTIQLRKILCHAFETVPYYRDVFQQVGLQRIDLERFTLCDLPRIPFLEKRNLRLFGKSKLLSSQREDGGEFFSSSGSTGTPTEILFSYFMHQRWSAAMEARVRHWAGVNRNMARGMIGGRRIIPDGVAKPPYYRYNYFEKQTYFSAYHIAPQTVASYVEGMWKNNVQYMTGYAVSNYILARFIRDLKLSAPKMQAVITSSEKLTTEMREIFEEVYQCKTFDSWSGVEACGLVSECEYGSLHISPDVGILEILDEDGKPVEPGQEGEVVCTGLLNFDQPLIRYRIGDRMKLGSGKCKCGRDLPIIDEIIGRVEDVVIGPDGREMVRFHNIFVGIPKIVEAQIVQWAIDRIEAKIVSEQSLSDEDKTLIIKRIKSQLGNVQVIVNEVDSIPRTAAGKFKAVISHIR